MTPIEIVDALRGGSRSAVVWGALRQLVRQRVGRGARDGQDRDDTEQNVMFKLAQQARGGVAMDATYDGEVIRYLDAMVRNCLNDAWRRQRRAPVLDDEKVGAARAPGSIEVVYEEAALVKHAMALFDRVAEVVVARTPEAYRAGRSLAWRQVEGLYFSDDTVDTLVIRDEGLGADPSPDEVRRAANRAMKQHERFRTAMLATAAELEAQGALTRDDLRVVERMVRMMKRR